MMRIVSIKFRTAGKLYDFDAKNFDLQKNDQVIVETDRGRALGTVVVPPREIARKQLPDKIKGVLRQASPQDLESARKFAGREKESLRFCQQRIQERKLAMKLVRAEYLFDGSKIVFYFTADGRIDFRDLVKDLAQYFHTRIEMRQIGVRDEAKIIGGMGICGRELCCCSFLRDFNPVSVKMAKEQGLALNPTKISGQCGRLLCCLGYEFETYSALRKGLPKCGRRVTYEGQEAEVVSQNILAQKVKIRLEDRTMLEVSAEDLKKGPAPKPEAEPKKADQPQEKKPTRRGKGGGRGERKGRGGGRPQADRKEKDERKQKPQAEKAQQSGPPATEDAEQKKTRRRRRRRPRKGSGGEGGSPSGSPSGSPKPTA